MPRRSAADIDDGVQLFRAAIYVGPACFIMLSLLWPRATACSISTAGRAGATG